MAADVNAADDRAEGGAGVGTRAGGALGAGAVSAEVERVAALVARSVVGVRGSPNSSGSGVVWNDAGLVVTNDHVVAGDRAEVVLVDGTRLPARVVRRSRELDLAALQVERLTPKLVAAMIGDSTALRVGGLVLAVGNPMGERNAVTLGMVSGTPSSAWSGRESEAEPGPGSRLLRLAIMLRPGNSGGALADAAGRVVGVPNMVAGPGLALAIPSATVEAFLSAGAGAAAAPGRDGLVWV
jgi:serine protease Do